MTLEFTLEVLNGNWGIVGLALAIICAAYLMHEFRARRILPFGRRSRLTDGIRMAVALFMLSAGVFIRSAESWRWRFTGAHLGDLNQVPLTIGDIVAVIGFLCALREISRNLFGWAPWFWTIVALVIFNVGSAVHKFW